MTDFTITLHDGTELGIVHDALTPAHVARALLGSGYLEALEPRPIKPSIEALADGDIAVDLSPKPSMQSIAIMAPAVAVIRSGKPTPIGKD